MWMHYYILFKLTTLILYSCCISEIHSMLLCYFKTVLWTYGDSALPVEQTSDIYCSISREPQFTIPGADLLCIIYGISVVFKLCDRSCANGLEWCLV
jgi:hypothetical protein